jgi:DNA-binding transcriptional regulator YiaG
MSTTKPPRKIGFGSDRLHRILAADPALAAEVRAGVAEMHEADRIYAASLKAIREASHTTQVVLAERLGVTQGQVSRIENAHDLLLSTLLTYLNAAGVTDVKLTARMNDRDVQIDLATAAS